MLLGGGHVGKRWWFLDEHPGEAVCWTRRVVQTTLEWPHRIRGKKGSSESDGTGEGHLLITGFWLHRFLLAGEWGTYTF